MAHDHDDVPPIVEKERRLGAFWAILLIGILVLVVVLAFSGDLFENAPVEPTEETDIKVEVESSGDVDVAPANAS